MVYLYYMNSPEKPLDDVLCTKKSTPTHSRDCDCDCDTLTTTTKPHNHRSCGQQRRRLSVIMEAENSYETDVEENYVSVDESHQSRKKQKLQDENDYKVDPLIKHRYERYCGKVEEINSLMFIALILDPRFKFKLVKIMISNIVGDVKGTELSNKVSSTMSDLFGEYKLKLDSSRSGYLK
ncbi:hypothetical protein ACFE04_027814 [Oxalis oulophora]